MEITAAESGATGVVRLVSIEVELIDRIRVSIVIGAGRSAKNRVY